MIDHPSGPGRIDTFTPYKTMNSASATPPASRSATPTCRRSGTSGIREGMFLHWDGNNPSVFERNISAAIGAGATPVSLDLPRMNRVADWLRDCPAARVPPTWKIDAALVKKGRSTLPPTALLGLSWAEGRTIQEPPGRQVVPIASVKTDRERLDSYTLDLAYNQYTSGPGETGSFTISARPEATPTSRWTESGHARPTSTTARCRHSRLAQPRLHCARARAAWLSPAAQRVGELDQGRTGPMGRRRVTA